MNPEFEILATRVLSALGNGLYQGVVLCVIVGIGFHWFRGISAATRHAAGMVALVVMAVLPVLHFFIGAPPSNSTGSKVDFPRSAEPVKLARPDEPTDLIQAPDLVDTGVETRARSRFLAGVTMAPAVEGSGHVTVESELPEDSPFTTEAPRPGQDAPLGSTSVSPSLRAENSRLELGTSGESDLLRFDGDGGDAIGITGFDLRTSAGLGAPLLARSEEAPDAVSEADAVSGLGSSWEWVTRFRSASRAWRPELPAWMTVGMVAIWIMAAGLGVLRILAQCLALRRVKHLAGGASEALERRFRQLCIESKLRRPVVLGITDELGSPVAAGFLRPAILLPVELAEGTPGSEMSQLLRHELAHLKRGDDWSNLVQLTVRALFFFHPGVWWLAKRLAVDREIACDDHVLAATRTPREYALFLTDFAGRTRGRHWAVAPAAWSKRSQLTERIHMILDTHRNASPSVARAKVCTFGAMAALIAALGLYAGPRVALAASEDRAEPTSSAASAGTAEGAATSVSSSASAIASPEAKVKERAVVSVDGRTAVVTSVSADGTTSTLEAALPEPAPSPHPTPALSPTPALAPLPAPAALAPVAPVPPQPPFHRWKRAESDDSLEARLERLEKMVESMVERTVGNGFKEGKGFMKFEYHGPSEKELQDIARVAREAGERAGRDAARAAKEVARMAQADQQKMRAEQDQLRAKAKQSEVKIRRDALEEQRRVLEKQIHEMERQIEHLSNKLERIEEQVDEINDSDESDEVPAKPRAEIKTRDQTLTLSVDVKPEVRISSEDSDRSKQKDKLKEKEKEKTKEPVKF